MEITSKYQRWVYLKVRGGLPEERRALQDAACWIVGLVRTTHRVRDVLGFLA